MELYPEAYFLIVRYVDNRTDLCSLAQVSSSFRAAAERALYNTIQLSDPSKTRTVCRLFSSQPRISALVRALSIVLREDVDDQQDEPSLPPDYWDCIARALQQTKRLRHLNIHIDGSWDSVTAWVLRECSFQLYTFHCDLAWDPDLIRFLSTQSSLSDLYIADFNEDTPDNIMITTGSLRQASSMPILSFLECTFTEAVGAFAPGRPLTHVKTCFSRSEPNAKRAEMAILISNLRLATKPLQSLDVADSSYTGRFSLEFLTHVVGAFSDNLSLRYLGALALPVNGKERLQFYGQLRRLPLLQHMELELSEWDPLPATPAALRAIANEIQLYCPSIQTVVFICDFEPFVMRKSNGVWNLDDETEAEALALWRH
ncbi:hypothetical protein DENSPDRAFT_777801 [Dentipellis sp. KUC8613]|nr:hypothetical protein DENSPDRAFT_777801 [Dentipellis sp. KUC8613]